ncbi:MAG: relaxase/mobilization nuclease domain-containing protein [Hyphomicrobiaceae bacterium]
MVPRLHKRGTSFKEACRYVLHDQGKDTTDRVLWTGTQNLGDLKPKDAWRAMLDTWKDRTRLKREAGVDLRGRDNTAPVLHLTLAWALDEKPDEKHMRETALAALKALKLDEHQALIAAHSDKDHLHVHLIVNTVHPETGRTAALKHSKLELSKWAEAYEREHGIKCEQRIENNAERERNRQQKTEKQKLTPEHVLGMAPAPKPVRDRSPSRDRAIARKDVVNRMKRLRAELDHRHMVERDVNYSRHRRERRALLSDTRSVASGALEYMETRFRPRWRDLYNAQREEAVRVDRASDNLLERAVFVFCNSERLGNGKPLSFRQKLNLIRSPSRLGKAVASLHQRERNILSGEQKRVTGQLMDRVWAEHDRKKTTLMATQRNEIATQRAAQRTVSQERVSYLEARTQLRMEREGAVPPRQAPSAPARETDLEYVARIRAEMAVHAERNVPKRARFVEEPQRAPSAPVAPSAPMPARPAFDRAVEPPAPEPLQPPAAPQLSRSEQIKRDMEAWRKRNPGRDYGREM